MLKNCLFGTYRAPATISKILQVGRKRDVKPPLALFQTTEADREETRKLVHAVSSALECSAVRENNLNELFDAMWPQLEKQLGALPASVGVAARRRSTEDMIAEVLDAGCRLEFPRYVQPDR